MFIKVPDVVMFLYWYIINIREIIYSSFPNFLLVTPFIIYVISLDMIQKSLMISQCHVSETAISVALA